MHEVRSEHKLRTSTNALSAFLHKVLHEVYVITNECTSCELLWFDEFFVEGYVLVYMVISFPGRHSGLSAGGR